MVRSAVSSHHRDQDPPWRRSSSMVAGDNSTTGAVKAEPLRASLTARP
jgi:hypothetical protein